MELGDIYRPIGKELKEVKGVLTSSLAKSKNNSILSMGRFLLDSPGKRIRPALVIFSFKAISNDCSQGLADRDLKLIASAIELIHIASLVHDDVIDRAGLRHNKPTVNSKWGQDVSIALGDYLYSLAFELISQSGNADILQCISSATKAMCEGELLQVCERDNLDLLKEHYIVMVKKKTACLFAASCQAGALISNPDTSLQDALKEYGLNFGIAFQIIDDYLDLIAEQETTGKPPGQDIRAGEVTLPLLNLWESVSRKERKELKVLLASRTDKQTLERIRTRFLDSGAADKTKQAALYFINLAKKKINAFSYSSYKQGLFNLADFIIEHSFIKHQAARRQE